jgi:hypothetical protein
MSVGIRFFVMFFQKFFPSVSEKAIHVVLALGALAAAYKRGKASEQFWEIMAPIVWALSVLLIWHTIATAIRLWRENKLEKDRGMTERELPILGVSGTRVKVFVSPDVVPFFILKISGITLMLCIIAIVPVYLTLRGVGIEAESPPITSPAPPGPYSVKLGPFFWNPKRNQVFGWWLGDVMQDGSSKDVKDIRHASVVVYVTAQNLQSVESLIDYYGLQVKTEGGEWVDLKRMNAMTTATFLVFENTGLKVAHLCEIPDLLDKSIVNGNIVKPGAIFKG